VYGTLLNEHSFSAGIMLTLQEIYDFPSAVSQVNEHGWPPLHKAAAQRLVTFLEMVVLHGG